MPKTFDSYFLDMIYVEFMKNFLLADSSELMAVRLISASWAQKRLIPTLYLEFRNDVLLDSIFPEPKNFYFSPIPGAIPLADWLLDSFWPPEPKNGLIPTSVDMMYVEFMENFLLADSSELLAVRLILASWAQKLLIPTF